MTPDSGNGLIGSLIMLTMLRITGRQVIMHHHVFSYLNEASPVSRMFFRMARRGVRHIVLCARMGELMQNRYGGGFDVVVQSNAALVGAAVHRPERRALRTIGYLSNITTDKGIDTFLATAGQLASRYPDLKVLIAGPAANGAVRSLVEQFVAADKENRHYLGPVYGADKAAFFEQVDVLMFPTRYKNEAEPLVIFEAARAGTLVIASDRGCICEQITDRDLVVAESDDFVQRAAGRVGAWIDDPAAFAKAWRATEAMRNPPALPALPIA
jgi:glycosyltransferase involved in cell wall biosynthesis